MSVTSSAEMFEIVVSDDENTLWVNAFDGSCIARFSKKFGIDIHNTATDQIENNAPQCRYCTHHAPDNDDWLVFRQKVLSFYGLDIDVDLIRF